MGPKKSVEREDDIDIAVLRLIALINWQLKSISRPPIPQFNGPHCTVYYTNEGRLACVYIFYTSLDIHSHNYFRRLLELAIKLWF